MLTKEACKILGVTMNTLLSYHRKGFISRKPYRNTFDYNDEDIEKIVEYKDKNNTKYFSSFEKRTSWNKGKNFSKKSREKMSKSRYNFFKNNPEKRKECGISSKLTISKIKKKYSFFSKIEQIRYNPDKPKEKEIQVRCKNHLCPNSKEKDGWFTPNYIQLYERIRALERPVRMIENNFYCSNNCKGDCPLFGLQSDPFKETKKIYTQEEYQQFREYVLERDNYKCQYCEDPATIVHHERPQKSEPFFALDPDFAWSCCKKCHYKYGHETDTECSTGKLASKICK